MPKKRQCISNRRAKAEREIARDHLGTWVAEGSAGQAFLRELCSDVGKDFVLKSLETLGRTYSAFSGIKFPRDFCRQKLLIVKWFDDNLDRLRPLRHIVHIELERKEKKKKQPDAEKQEITYENRPSSEEEEAKEEEQKSKV